MAVAKIVQALNSAMQIISLEGMIIHVPFYSYTNSIRVLIYIFYTYEKTVN